MPEYANDVLIEPEWLVGHLDDDGIRIVEVDEEPGLYREAHIPGAIGLDWELDLQDQLTRQFLGPEAFAALFGSRGVSDDHLVILYGDQHNWFAAYAYWYLKYYGHHKVKLLNGPRERWIAEGLPTSTELPDFPPAMFTARPGDASIRALREEVLAALDGDGGPVLVDVRSPQEFAGDLIAPPGYEQEGAQRAGHIPGAESIPWWQAMNDDGSFKSEAELRELYGREGVLDRPIIAYCRIGERAAHTWFVLHELLGEPDVRTYDGSWTEWGSLVGVPIERG